jgi:hypothetical protein
MKNYQKIVLTAALALPVLLQSCSKDNVSQYSTGSLCQDTVSYAQKIQPLINQNCSTSGCHDTGSQAGGYDFTDYGTVAAHASLMISAMRHESGVSQMPQGQPQLADSLIQQFSCWIEQGKLEN